MSTYKPLHNFPEICSKDCPHVQCSSWGTLEMQGKPCRNRVETNEQWSKSQANAKFIRNLENGIEEAMRKGMKQFEARLQALENTEPRKPLNRFPNGTSPKIFRESLALGTIYD